MTPPTERPPLSQLFTSLAMTSVVMPALTLGLAGDATWVEGWLFALWVVAMIGGSTAYLFLYDPALLAERRKRPGSDNQKPWDRVMLTGIYLLAMLWFVVLPLDARRFHLSPAFPAWVEAVGGLMLVPALYLILKATMQNTFMSTMVRIQSERQQQVVSTGVYGLVRHPLYLGCLFMMWGSALMLGSVVGLGINVIATAGLLVRILGEEAMLVSELPGYVDYQRQVRWRVLPGVW